MVICKHCQAELPEHIHFCGRCGHTVDEEISLSPTLLVGDDRRQSPPTENNAPTVLMGQGVADVPTKAWPTDNMPPIGPMLEASAMQSENPGVEQYGAHQQMQGAHSGYPQSQGAHAAHHQPQEAHGVHHQPQEAHGIHHQPQQAHGVHHQPQQAHGALHQSQAAHGAHQQSQAVHGIHHQPQQAVHGIHHQSQAVHQIAHQSQAAHRIAHQSQAVHKAAHQGCRPSCLVTGISTAAVLTVTASLILFFLYNSFLPGKTQPTLNVPTSVNPGSLVVVQGSNFAPGLHIWITLDKQQKVQVEEPVLLPQADVLGASQDLAQSLQGIPLTVKADGTFVTTVQSDPSWHTGSQHTIYISRQDGSLIVRREFTVKAGSPTPTPVVVSCNTSNASVKTTMGPVVTGQNTPVSTVLKLCSQEGGSWSATTTTDDGANWLSVNPSTGTLQKGATQDITVMATAANLTAGTYTGHVVVNNGANTTHLDVTFTVTNTPQACLAVNTNQLNFTAKAQGSNPAAQGVTISNSCSTGNWSATVDQSWLALSATNGNIASNSNSNVNVQPSIASMATGTYIGHVTFNPGAVTVTVTLNVQPIPCISVQGSPLNIGVMQANASSAARARVAISNGASCASGNWTAQSDVSWITLNVSSGSLNAGAGTVIPFTVNETAVGTGSFTGHITFSPGSGSSVMTVNLTVYRNLCITATPGSLTFNGNTGYAAASQRFNVTNCANAGTVSVSSITTSDGGSWLSATGGGSLPAGGSQTFTVTPSVITIAGTYTATLYVTITGSDGGTTTIQVGITYNVSQLII